MNPARAGAGLSVFAGRDLAEARAMIPGNKEFGQWCSENFSEHNIDTLRLLRIRFEVFGTRQLCFRLGQNLVVQFFD